MARQRTLEASVAWSHDLLDGPEQLLFRRLSVFAGGFTLEAAESVCADEILDDFAVLEYLTRLVDKSLVQANSGEGGTRYRLLETIRHYAGARLIEADDVDRVRKGHFDYFLGLAEGAAPELVRADGPAWLANLELEHENLRAALEWVDGAKLNDLFLAHGYRTDPLLGVARSSGSRWPLVRSGLGRRWRALDHPGPSALGSGSCGALW
jgi:predicted ATPase